MGVLKLGPSWRQVARRAWSVRLAVVAACCSTTEMVLPLCGHAMPVGLFAALALLASLGSILARLSLQKELP